VQVTNRKIPRSQRDSKAEFEAAKLMLAAAESKLRRAHQIEARAIASRRDPTLRDVLEGRVRSQGPARGMLRVGERVTADMAIENLQLMMRHAKQTTTAVRSQQAKDAVAKRKNTRAPSEPLYKAAIELFASRRDLVVGLDHCPFERAIDGLDSDDFESCYDIEVKRKRNGKFETISVRAEEGTASEYRYEAARKQIRKAWEKSLGRITR
jgi:hypothetical protein